jgi:hypothetical protein
MDQNRAGPEAKTCKESRTGGGHCRENTTREEPGSRSLQGCKAMGEEGLKEKRRQGLHRQPQREEGGTRGCEAEVGLCPASWAVPHLPQLDSNPTPCPVTGHSIGLWGTVTASGSCQGPKHLSPASSRAQVSLGSQGNAESRHQNRWQRSLQRAGPEETW